MARPRTSILLLEVKTMQNVRAATLLVLPPWW
jgi:hypothetical protein